MGMIIARLGVSEPSDIATARQMFEMVSGVVQPFNPKEKGVVKALVPEDNLEGLRLNVGIINEQAGQTILELI